jgi:hypothetical protein
LTFLKEIQNVRYHVYNTFRRQIINILVFRKINVVRYREESARETIAKVFFLHKRNSQGEPACLL